MHLLYIDDDEDDRDLFQKAISSISTDITCYEASDGVKAFRRLDEMENLPDYIFVDINMPRMDGLEFLRRIKQSLVYRSIPVIIFSTSSDPDEQTVSLELGASKYLVKPNSFGSICEIISTVLRPRSGHRQMQ